jgi:hypothetical protein
MKRLPILVAGLVLTGAATGYGAILFLGDSGSLEFEEVAAEKGPEYKVTTGEVVTRGGGVYVTDFNNDGWPDVLAIGGTARKEEYGWGPAHPELFENVGGEFKRSGVLPLDELRDKELLGALFFDYDNDGWEDLLLLTVDGEPVFLENRNGRFEIIEVGLDTEFNESIGATAADYNRDGCLDVFIIQNGDWEETTPVGYGQPNSSIDADNGNPNALFRGDCNSFERVDADIDGERWSLATSFTDFTGDGWPDIHVANDYNHDYLYVNQRNETFHGVELGSETNRNGMSSEVLDVNQDGRSDIFITNIHFNMSNLTDQAVKNYFRYRLGKRVDGGNSLLVNRGGGNFAAAAEEYGTKKGGWGWAAAAVDFDNDGDVDLIHSTKQFSPQFTESIGDPSYTRYPTLYERTAAGTFVSRNASELGFEGSNGQGLAHADFDRDGDQDVIIGQFLDGKFHLYENKASGNWLQVRVAGDRSQTPIGARVMLSLGEEKQYSVNNARADFISQDTQVLHFGLGSTDTVDRIRVVWPNGTEQVFRDVDANQRIVVTPKGEIREVPREQD